MGFEVLLKGKNMIRLLAGLGVAFRISLISVIISIILGLIIGMLVSAKKPVINTPYRVYLETVRIMPQLVLLFIVYFRFSKMTGINLSAEIASIIVFSLFRIGMYSLVISIIINLVYSTYLYYKEINKLLVIW